MRAKAAGSLSAMVRARLNPTSTRQLTKSRRLKEESEDETVRRCPLLPPRRG